MSPKKSYMYNKRKSMDTSSDPYLMSGMTNGVSVCKECHAIFHNKRWYLDEALYTKKNKQKGINRILCPACRKVKDNFPGGIVRLKGEFFKEHKKEIFNLIKNEEEHARGFNPLERIVKIIDSETDVEITTTNEKLAQRIGKSIQKAYQGRIAYTWSDDTKLLRAEWER